MHEFFSKPTRTTDPKVDGTSGPGSEEMTRQMLGSGQLMETFKKGAKRQPLCTVCHLEIAPAAMAGADTYAALVLRSLPSKHEECR